MFHIMAYNIAGTRCKSQFQNEIVVWVRQEWPPKEKYFLQMGLFCHIAEKSKRILWRTIWRQVFGVGEYLLPFEVESCRKAKLERRRGNRTDQGKAGADVGSRCSYQHARIEHDPHAVYSHIFHSPA